MTRPVAQIDALAARHRRAGPLRYLLLIAMLVTLAGCGDDESAGEAPPAQTSADTIARYDATVHQPQPPAAVAPQPIEPAPKPTMPLPTDAGCITAACHASFPAAAHVHGPVSAGACDVCHAEDDGKHNFPLKRSGNDLCEFCHSTVGHRSRVHAAVEDSGCIACHDPHASQTNFLLTADSVEALCLTCHELPPGIYAHGPMATGACTACHEPHEADYANLLRGGDGPEHCFTCHDEMRFQLTNAPYTHEPAIENCLICHEAHRSDYEHQLTMPTEQVCFGCHRDIEARIGDADPPHAAVFTADRCANCHDPHGAGRPKLLRDRTDRLCLTCHDRPIQARQGRTIPNMALAIVGRRYLHGPVTTGDCTACHNAHGASHAKLLDEQFAETFYAPFDLQHYQLCLRCHNEQMVLAETTTNLTDFRNGDQNLHYLHVNRQTKGRTCRTCHEIHGSDLPKHMAESVPFEGASWPLPIEYRKTEDGGSCAPGCHEPMAYSRTPTPGSSPAPGSSPEVPQEARTLETNP